MPGKTNSGRTLSTRNPPHVFHPMACDLNVLLDHVLIYGLALFVACVCVCVSACGVHVCVCLGAVQCLHLSLQACSGSHVESNSVVFEYRPGQQTF